MNEETQLAKQILPVSPIVVQGHYLEQVQALITESGNCSSIENEDQHQAAGLFLKQVTKLEGRIESERKDIKAPYFNACKQIDLQGKILTTPLATEKKRLAELIGAFEKARAERAASVVPDENGIIVREGTGGTQHTITTIKNVGVVVNTPPLEYLVPDQKKIDADVKSGVLTPKTAPWLKFDTKYEVKSR